MSFTPPYVTPLSQGQGLLSVQIFTYPKACTGARPFHAQPCEEGTELTPIFRSRNRGSERLSDLPKVTELAGGRVGAETPSPSLDRAPWGSTTGRPQSPLAHGTEGGN